MDELIESKPSKWFINMLDYLWDNRETIIKNYKEFAYPEYCGLPKEISMELTDEVDEALQPGYGNGIIEFLQFSDRRSEFATYTLDLIQQNDCCNNLVEFNVIY